MKLRIVLSMLALMTAGSAQAATVAGITAHYIELWGSAKMARSYHWTPYYIETEVEIYTVRREGPRQVAGPSIWALSKQVRIDRVQQRQQWADSESCAAVIPLINRLEDVQALTGELRGNTPSYRGYYRAPPGWTDSIELDMPVASGQLSRVRMTADGDRMPLVLWGRELLEMTDCWRNTPPSWPVPPER